MHAGGASHLGYPADSFLHFFGRNKHQIGQLVDHHHHLWKLSLSLSLGGVGVVGGKIACAYLRKSTIALHHLGNRPLKGTRRLFGIGHHGDEQMGDAVVNAQLHHLGVHHDEADLLRRGLIKQGNNERVGTHRFARAGGSRDEQMGQLGDVPHDAGASDILAHGKGNL
ncbi:hypothetical protein SDC9_118872 [bioreactor metagenome]|uniref:Uncharacterized protein n=1 Tax=bioreactor metagenome TaxID=1076179 RepID=A0A645C4K7_9ZZZZ